MKRIFIIIPFLFVFLQTKATGQMSDKISLNGEIWELLAKPINMDPILYKQLREFLPQNRCTSTANWDGYTAFWEILDNYLCLQQIEICVYDEASNKDSTLIYDAESLQCLFAPYCSNGRIQAARWISGELRAGKGNLKSIYPWEILFINGQHTSEHSNLSIVLWEKDSP